MPKFAINDFLPFFATLFLLPIEFIVDRKLYFDLSQQLMSDCVNVSSCREMFEGILILQFFPPVSFPSD